MMKNAGPVRGLRTRAQHEGRCRQVWSPLGSRVKAPGWHPREDGISQRGAEKGARGGQERLPGFGQKQRGW